MRTVVDYQTSSYNSVICHTAILTTISKIVDISLTTAIIDGAHVNSDRVRSTEPRSTDGILPTVVEPDVPHEAIVTYVTSTIDSSPTDDYVNVTEELVLSDVIVTVPIHGNVTSFAESSVSVTSRDTTIDGTAPIEPDSQSPEETISMSDNPDTLLATSPDYISNAIDVQDEQEHTL